MKCAALFPASIVLAAAPALSAQQVVTPDRLPYSMGAGWEASDEDPVEGVSGLSRAAWRPADPVREPGPQGAVRWYRLRIDFSKLHGEPLALAIGPIRDVDEAYLEGVRIGGTGSFPPRLETASIQPRIYALPTHLVNRDGSQTLALRIYHNPSSSSVFRFEPHLDRLYLTRYRSYVDQALTASAALLFSLASALFLFHRGDSGASAPRSFAMAAALASLYLLSGHTSWSHLPLPASVPFRLAATTGALLCVCYGLACWQVLRRPPPRRFRAYFALFVAYAVAAAALPDLALLVVPTRLIRILSLVSLVDLFLATLRSVGANQRRAMALLASHLVFGLGIVYMNLRPSSASFSAAPWMAVLVLAGGLYAVGLRQIRARFAAVQHERSRISRDLHDTVAQSLVGISLRLDAALDALAHSPEAAREQVERAQALVCTSLDESRRAVWRIRAQAQAGRDLAAALAHLGDALTNGTGVRVRVETCGDPRALSTAVESSLFRIGQEALTNVVRHARASEIRVQLRFEPGSVRLHVRDDGRGLTPAGAVHEHAPHFGLLGMRERAEELGGHLEVSSVNGRGTEIAVTVPLREA